ncbi:TraB/GumN family protein [Rhabdobacter roseus]|uniref:TraB/GumN family protein n=1 Tax=Rhabdobacter roseus TaxID=1655419 RepID=A0A840TJF5_9BACT|nr:TraB/GumN family protein [Rhabdobacter roseus]MBB5281927.1 hypothetical protein [Rhabdobacter roseus]
MIKKLVGLLLLAGGLFPASSRAQVPTEPALLWKISNGRGPTTSTPSYLFGTIHLICPQDFSLSDTLKSCLKQTEQVALEIDMDDPGLMTAMAQGMLMRNDNKLSQLLPEPQYQHLHRFFKDSVGMNISTFDRAKPFMLMSILFNRVLACQPQSYEMALVGLAKQQQAEVVGLETVAEQMAVFDSIPYEKQAYMLVQFIDSLPQARQEFGAMVKLYKQQDVAGLFNLTLESTFELEGQQETLLFARNRRWIPLMAQMMQAKPTFFAVGAAHLGGEEGVIALLRKQGYRVEPVR